MAFSLQVNYGGLLLQALLEYWPRPYAVEEESDVDAGVKFKSNTLLSVKLLLNRDNVKLL